MPFDAMPPEGMVPPLDPGDFPPRGVTLVSRFDEAIEILRSPMLKPGQGTTSIRVAVDPAGTVQFADEPTGGRADPHAEMLPWDDLFRRGVLSHIHGASHTQRRRALNPLFGRDAHIWFRDKVIMPTLTRNLAGVLGAPGTDGTSRADMALFAKRVFVQASAALVGFDEARTEVGADTLIGLQAKVEYGRHLGNYLAPKTAEVHEHMTAALDAQNEVFERFYVPSLESRRRLVARYQAGHIGESELPHDLLTLIARGAASIDDPQVGFAVAMHFAQGSIGTNVQILLHSLADLTSWFAEHNEDQKLRTDPMFLEGALVETIRLHSTGTGTLSRVALEDVTLASGRVISKGQYVALLKDTINRDQAVFGPDADRFNPRRVVPVGVYPFGVGFGSGSHMCIGLPLVMGQGGITGMQVPVIQRLQEAGIRLDPGRPAEKRAELLPFRHEYVTFPVVFAGRG